MANPGDRRPIGQRKAGWAKWGARQLDDMGLTPNQISVASIAFALVGGMAFWLAGMVSGEGRVVALIIGALCCQLRLLANMFDGMVAVEGGQGTPDGPFWNEVPDRIADVLLFVGAGYGVVASNAGPAELGWLAALMAVGTAYIREVGRANGLPADFGGILPKPRRMALLTGAAVLSMFEGMLGLKGEVMALALILIALGSAYTAVERSQRILAKMDDWRT